MTKIGNIPVIPPSDYAAMNTDDQRRYNAKLEKALHKLLFGPEPTVKQLAESEKASCGEGCFRRIPHPALS